MVLRNLTLTLVISLHALACGAKQPAAFPPAGAEVSLAKANAEKPREETIEVVETCGNQVEELGVLGRGILPRAEVRKTLGVAQPRFDDCLTKANARGAQLNGTLAFAFVVGGDGKVVSAWADEETSTVNDPAFACCVVRAVKRIVFPEPRGGTVVGTYSLNLRNDSVASRDATQVSADKPSGT